MSGPLRNEERRARLAAAWPVNVTKFAAAECTSPGAIYRMARELGLGTKPRKHPAKLGQKHKAIQGRTTRQPKSIVSAKHSPRVLVPGSQNRKLGERVTKGKWAGLPIYQVTLIERASCPTSCAVWDRCYGNSMPFARRHILDGELIKRLDVELDIAAARHRQGFLVRLHTLGDFGKDAAEALPYIAFWRGKMAEIPGLHVFGFTAHGRDSAAGAAVMGLNRDFPDRCRIRFSGSASDDGFGAMVIESEADSRHVVCPWEMARAKKPANCGACGLCWSMDRTVEFMEH